MAPEDPGSEFGPREKNLHDVHVSYHQNRLKMDTMYIDIKATRPSKLIHAH